MKKLIISVVIGVALSFGVNAGDKAKNLESLKKNLAQTLTDVKGDISSKIEMGTALSPQENKSLETFCKAVKNKQIDQTAADAEKTSKMVEKANENSIIDAMTAVECFGLIK